MSSSGTRGYEHALVRVIDGTRFYVVAKLLHVLAGRFVLISREALCGWHLSDIHLYISIVYGNVGYNNGIMVKLLMRGDADDLLVLQFLLSIELTI